MIISCYNGDRTRKATTRGPFEDDANRFHKRDESNSETISIVHQFLLQGLIFLLQDLIYVF